MDAGMSKTEEKMRRIVNCVADAAGVDAHANLANVVEFVRQNNITSQQATRYVNIMDANSRIANVNDPANIEYTNMLNSFKIGEWYSSEQVDAILSKCFVRYKHVLGTTTKSRTMHLNTVFETESKKKSVSGAKVDGYMIVSRAKLPELK